MRSLLLALSLLASLAATSALAGDAETKAGRDAIDGQIEPFWLATTQPPTVTLRRM